MRGCETHPPVLVEQGGGNVGWLLAGLDLSGDAGERLSEDGAQHCVDHGHVLRIQSFVGTSSQGEVQIQAG